MGRGALLLVLLACCMQQALASPQDAVPQPAIVVIIDDLGDNLARGEAALALPGPITYAILPHSPHADELAQRAYAEGKEVILHAPMANAHRLPLGPGALTPDLSRSEFVRTLRDSLASVPHAIGLNNHMGSLLTEREEPMRWVMEEARRQGLFFVDSRTSPRSQAWEIAQAEGIPSLRRDVFLDHEQTRAFVHRQFMQTVRIAQKYGTAVAIGHPYPVTVDYLNWALPLLDEWGIRLVSAAALLLELQERQRLETYYAMQKERAERFSELHPCDSRDGYCDPALVRLEVE